MNNPIKKIARMRNKHSSNQTLSYRADVDGLRAVAVLLVLCAHLRALFNGGYIGVDVFFVISGYLISSDIFMKMDEERFSLLHFYRRRIRRIFPALVVMLAFTTILGWHFLFPSEFRDYSKSLLAALFSTSNFFLLLHQDAYFGSPLNPLLHTWSLAVEEQFYLFFPMLIVVIRYFAPDRLKLAVITTAILSFAFAVYNMRDTRPIAFYSSPLRAWELLIGTVLSQHYLPEIKSSSGRNCASIFGFCLIILPALGYTPGTPFPGLTALPPCLGAVLIIAAGETGPSIIGSLLSLRPVVFIGLISYSVYLWHWPLLVFQEYSRMLINEPIYSPKSKSVVFILSLITGALSWFFVEIPFRKDNFHLLQRQLILINGAALSVLTLTAIAILVRGGVPERFPPSVDAAANYLTYDMNKPYRTGVCFVDENRSFKSFDQTTCLHGDDARKNYLLIGDSHAAQLWPGLAAIYSTSNISEATIASCKPFPLQPREANQACKEMSDFLFSDYIPHHRVDILLLAARWNDNDFSDIGRTIDFASRRGIRVVLFGPMIEYELPIPHLIASSLLNHDVKLVNRSRDQFVEMLDKRLAALAHGRWNVPYISFYDDLCSPDCPVYARPGVPMIFDTHHLTEDGSIAFARIVRDREQIPAP
jgi:peptidoglycan/LPS O-acetylase OafA/YrhL